MAKVGVFVSGPACLAFDDAERASIEGRELDRPIAIMFLSPERFAASPQVGLPIELEWASVARWLSAPSFADDKTEHGAWCPCVPPGGVVKDGKGPVSLLVADVDECTEGAIDRSVEALDHCQGVIIPTFRATRESPRHRIVLVPDRPIQQEEWPILWPQFAFAIEKAGIVGLDHGCKNINRLYFAPVARGPEVWLGACALRGQPVPVDAMLAAARKRREAEERDRARRRASVGPVRHPDRYIRAALEKERANVLASVEPNRHPTLLKAAYALARLDLTEDQIADALLDAFVAVAGEGRRREGERAIRDAVAARRRAA